MSSVTPIKTGIKRYKIHGWRHFLIPIEFHIQFWIALWSTQHQYSECYLKCLFRTLSYWTSQVITAAAKKPPLANRKLLHFSPWLRNMMREEKYYSECAMCNYYTALTIYCRSEEIVLSRHTDYVSRPLPRKLNKIGNWRKDFAE